MAKIGLGQFGGVVSRSGQTPTAQAQGDLSGGMAEAGLRLGGAISQQAETLIVQAERQQVKAEQEADASAVFAARRSLDDWERKNVYDPKEGAITRRGADAFELPTTLPKAFDESAAEIGKTLTNQRQRMAFNEVTTSRRAQIGGFADRHALQEKRSYDEGQYQADIGSSMNRAALVASTGDLTAANTEVAIAQTRTTGYLRSLGKSEEEIGAAVRAVGSKASVTTISLLLDQDLPMKADEYLKANAGAMNVEDLLRSKLAVGKAVDARVGLTVASDTIKANLMPALASSDSTRLMNLAGDLDFNRLNAAKRQVESGNRDLNKDGSVVTSPKGAKGRDQVMDATNADPGYGVVPARDGSLAERSRVGTDYLGAMIKEFKGDVRKALAAYNAGPGAVNNAVKAASNGRGNEGDFMAFMPAETQAYVKSVSAKYAAGDGAPAVPTLASLHQQVRDKVGLDSPQRLKVALDDVTRQYKDMLEGKKAGEEKAEADVLQWLSDNKGDFAKMPHALRKSLPPGKIDNAMTFAGKIAAGVPVQTDWNTYTQLRAMATDNPQKFAGTDLRSYYPSIAPAQREQLLDLQTKANQPDQLPKVVALASQLSIAHNQLDITGSGSKNPEKRGMFDNAVTLAIADDQRDKKRELTFEERDKIIKRLQLPLPGSGGWLLKDKKAYTEPGAGIPDDMRKQIEAALKSENKEVTDLAVRDKYQRFRTLQGR